MHTHEMSIHSVDANGPGTLPGYDAICSCGWWAGSSIKSMVEDWASQHVAAYAPVRTDYVMVGKYAKSTDPEMVSRMRQDGYRTTAEAVGRYVYECDSEMFTRTMEFLRED